MWHQVSQLLPHSQELLHMITDCCIAPLLQQLPVLLSQLGVLCYQGLVGLNCAVG
jgi:hypothetical protein